MHQNKPSPENATRHVTVSRSAFSVPLNICQRSEMISLIDKLNSVCADVSLSLPIPSEKPTHNFITGQQVLIRSLKPVVVGEPRYSGPAVDISVTRMGVLTAHKPQWIHASRLKHLSTYALPIDTVGPKKPAQSV